MPFVKAELRCILIGRDRAPRGPSGAGSPPRSAVRGRRGSGKGRVRWARLCTQNLNSRSRGRPRTALNTSNKVSVLHPGLLSASGLSSLPRGQECQDPPPGPDPRSPAGLPPAPARWEGGTGGWHHGSHGSPRHRLAVGHRAAKGLAWAGGQPCQPRGGSAHAAACPSCTRRPLGGSLAVGRAPISRWTPRPLSVSGDLWAPQKSSRRPWPVPPTTITTCLRPAGASHRGAPLLCSLTGTPTGGRPPRQLTTELAWQLSGQVPKDLGCPLSLCPELPSAGKAAGPRTRESTRAGLPEWRGPPPAPHAPPGADRGGGLISIIYARGV